MRSPLKSSGRPGKIFDMAPARWTMRGSSKLSQQQLGLALPVGNTTLGKARCSATYLSQYKHHLCTPFSNRVIFLAPNAVTFLAVHVRTSPTANFTFQPFLPIACWATSYFRVDFDRALCAVALLDEGQQLHSHRATIDWKPTGIHPAKEL